jgi:hypothetical protein
MASLVIIIACMVAAVLIWRNMISNSFAALNSNANPGTNTANISYPLEQLYFEYYLLAGLCIGCLASFFIFRAKKINQIVLWL